MKKKLFTLVLSLCLIIGVLSGMQQTAKATWLPTIDYKKEVIIITGADSTSVFTINGTTYPQGTTVFKISESWFGTEIIIQDNTGITLRIEIKPRSNSSDSKGPDDTGSSTGNTNDGYSDIDSGSWYYGAVSYVTKMGLMSGRGNNTFKPNVNTTREEVASVLFNIAGDEYYPNINNSFTDVLPDSEYLTAILWGVENNIVNGTSETSFGTGKSVTREQLAAFFFRLAKHLNYDTSGADTLSSYSDSSSVSSYAVDAMSWAVKDGIMNGVGNNMLNPQGTATRAQVAAMVQRFFKLVNPYF